MKPRHAIVADLNGAHMRLGVADIDELIIDHYVQFRSDAFGSFKKCLEAYLRSLRVVPQSLSVALTSPEKFDSSQRPLSRKDAEALGFVEAFCVTDTCDALALALPTLSTHDLHQIGGGHPATHNRNKTVISLAAGLRVSTIISTDAGTTLFGCSVGNISFAAQTARDVEILERLRSDANHVAVGHLLSGTGLVLLYELLLEMSSLRITTKTPQEIIAAAADGSDPTASDAVDRFTGWLARFVGDIALMYDAFGGVYLSGAIVRQLAPLLQRPSFRQGIDAKGRLSAVMKTIPVSLIQSDDVALKGAAIALSRLSGSFEQEKN